MEKARRALRALWEGRRRGVALILALCASALLLGLSLSLIYAGALPMARAARKITLERCRQLAESFLEAAGSQLARYNLDDPEVPYEAGKDVPLFEEESSCFYAFANEFLEDGNRQWKPYTEGDGSAVYQFGPAGDAGDDYGAITVWLRKLDQRGKAVGEDEDAAGKGASAVGILGGNGVDGQSYGIDAGDYDAYGAFRFLQEDFEPDPPEGKSAGEYNAECVRAAMRQSFACYRLVMEVSAARRDDAFRTSGEFIREDCFQPYFTWRRMHNDKPLPWNDPDAELLPHRYWVKDGYREHDGQKVFWRCAPTDPKNGCFCWEDGTPAERQKVELREDVYEERTDEQTGETYEVFTGEVRIISTWYEDAVISYVYCDEAGAFHTTYKRYIKAGEYGEVTDP